MIYNKRSTEKEFYAEKLTDIEVALHHLKLMDTHGNFRDQYRVNGGNIYFTMAENALKTMTNPFAKKMLIDKMAELKN